MSYKRISPSPVVEGGTGAQILTSHGILTGNGTGAIQVTAEPSNGQLLIGKTGFAPVLGVITSTAGKLTIANGAGTIDVTTNASLQTPTGFASWSAGGPYFDDTTLGSFSVLVAGTGYINGTLVTWTAPQTVTGLTAGNTYYISIDSAGTLQKTATYSSALFVSNIVLFECLRDSTPVTNNQITVKENHPYSFEPEVSTYNHAVIGTVIENNTNGANITLNGTQKIQINGADILADHGLYTTIPDSAGVGVTFRKMYTTAGGKWATYLNTDTFLGTWNNAGTPTALTANRFALYTLYASKDSLNTTTPFYFAILDTAQYNTLAAANNAISNGTNAVATAELAGLEVCQLGYIIYRESTASITQVTISKSTLRQTLSTGGTNTASLVTTVVTNFNNVLSSADTNVQAALDTLDDFGSGTGNQTVNLYTGAGVKAVTLGSTNTTSATTVQSGSTGISITSATANGPITINSGTGNLYVSDNAAATTLRFGTGAGIKGVTIGSTNSSSSTTVQSGSGALNITATGGALAIKSGAGALSISDDAANTTVKLGTGAGVKTTTIGSINTSSSTTINSGSGGVTMTGVASVVVANKNYVTINTTTGALGSDAGGGGGGSNYAFLMNQSNPDATVTGNGIYYVLGTTTPMTIVYDLGSACVATAGTGDGGAEFVVPVNGIYLFSVQVSLYSCTINTEIEVNLIIQSVGCYMSTFDVRPATTVNACAGFSVPAQLTAGDKVWLRVAGYGEAANTEGIWADSYLSGYKIA